MENRNSRKTTFRLKSLAGGLHRPRWPCNGDPGLGGVLAIFQCGGGGAGGDGGGVQTHGPAGKADRLRQVLNTGVPAALGQSHAPGAARRWVALRGRPAPDLLRPGLQTSGLG